jgi:hypothetical protein
MSTATTTRIGEWHVYVYVVVGLPIRSPASTLSPVPLSRWGYAQMEGSDIPVIEHERKRLA